MSRINYDDSDDDDAGPPVDRPLDQNARTKEAFLVCRQCVKPTKHHFIRENRAGGITGAREEIFGCSNCPGERRWGLLG